MIADSPDKVAIGEKGGVNFFFFFDGGGEKRGKKSLSWGFSPPPEKSYGRHPPPIRIGIK